MPLKLKVSFHDKDQAKSLGAFWDATSKVWYVPDHQPFDPFEKWFPVQAPDFILRDIVFILLNHRNCWKCKTETPIIALGGLRCFSKDEEESQWVFESDFKIFEYIRWIPEDIAVPVQKKFIFFKPGYSKTIDGEYYANHCVGCNSLQGDNFHHHQVGGAFFPYTVEEAQKIKMMGFKPKYDIPLNANPTNVLHVRVTNLQQPPELVNVAHFIASHAKAVELVD